MYRSRILLCAAAGAGGTKKGLGLDAKPNPDPEVAATPDPEAAKADPEVGTADPIAAQQTEVTAEHSGEKSEISEEVVPVQRWVQKLKDDRKVDENGEYIVSHVQWHTGELAYKTPDPPSHLEPRFGYQIVSVKKPITWWQHYRKYPRWSFAHVHIHLAFGLGITYLCAFMMDEIRRINEESKTPYGMVGDQLGRGGPPKKDRQIAFSAEQTEEMLQQAQDVFMSGKELQFAHGKDYAMKKIPRPKEFSVDDSLMKMGVPQPKFTAGAKPSGGGSISDLVRETNLNQKTSEHA